MPLPHPQTHADVWYIGLSSSLFAHLYDVCDASHLIKGTGGRMDVEMVERLDTIVTRFPGAMATLATTGLY